MAVFFGAVSSPFSSVFFVLSAVPSLLSVPFSLACISWMYGRMEYGQRKYPGFFTLHSLGFLGNEKSEGRQRMQETWKHISDGLVFVLKRDPRVRPDAFTEQFPAEKFADVLFSLMLSALLRQDYDPRAVLEITRRTLY